MINSQVIKIIETVDDKYIIGGSNAVMIHIGKDIRECTDLDLHLSKIVNIINLEEKIKMKIDVYYDQPEYSIINGIRVLKLENIITNKINRLLLKDIYDLSYLLKLNFDIKKIKIYNTEYVEKINLKNNIYKEFDLSKTIELINKIYEK